MASISDFPVEILLQIFEEADTLHLKRVCHAFDELLDFAKAINGKYWSTALKILESAIRKVELSVVPVNIVQLLPRGILADIIFCNEHILKKKEDERIRMQYINMNAERLFPSASHTIFMNSYVDIRSSVRWARSLSYSIVHEQKTFKLDTVEITDRMKVICQLIKLDNIDTAMFMIENYQNILNGSVKYIFCNKIATYSASVNNFDIYKKIIGFKDTSIHNFVFMKPSYYFSMYSHLEYFIQNQNLEAIQFILLTEKITELQILKLSIKMCASTVFDIYVGHIDIYECSTMDLINDSIKYNNLHAFEILLENAFIINKLDSDVGVWCGVLTIKYYEAIGWSAGCNKQFVDVFNNSSFMVKKNKEKEQELAIYNLKRRERELIITDLNQDVIQMKERQKKHKESIPLTKNNLKVISKRRNQKPHYSNNLQCQKSFHKKSHR